MAKTKKAALKKAATTNVADKKSAGRKTAKKSAKSNPRSASTKRELIDTGRDKRYARRQSDGQFKESDEVGKSLAQDRRKRAKRKVKSGQGDKGDR